ncbi:MAG: gliding motility-associated C-terminal domain-containing protein, partial [Bacteroidota bacterium]
LSYQGDIVNTIFSGDPEVFWGFTSATGGFNNTHEVCFTYSSDLNALDDVVVCPGGSIMLEASSGLSHSWFPTAGLSNSTIANPIVTPSQTTLYTVEIIDECNRPFFEEVLVEVAGDAITFDLGPDTFVCAGQPLVLDATSADAEYAWSTGENTSQISVQQAGSYSVTVTQTTTSCVTEDAVQISARALPEVTLPEDTSLCIGQTILLQASDPMATHQWQDGSSGASFLVTTPGQYMLTSTNECGSRDASIQVVIESCREVYLPNAFSPNNDGFNDRFFPDHGDDILEVTVLQIFDRWGNLHFENTNFPAGAALAGWDGQVNGEDAATGVYVYLLECVFRDGTTAQLSGSIHLIR